MMKTLYMIGGTMGVGKTAVCQQLKMNFPEILDNAKVLYYTPKAVFPVP